MRWPGVPYDWQADLASEIQTVGFNNHTKDVAKFQKNADLNS